MTIAGIAGGVWWPYDTGGGSQAADIKHGVGSHNEETKEN